MGTPADDRTEDHERATPMVHPVLTPAERRRTWLLGVAPVVVVTAGMILAALAGRATVADVVLGAVLYGGLLGLAAAVVSHERAEAAHCPRCDASGPLRRATCAACGYDLAARPLYACDQRHARHVAAGLCHCGRRLHRLEPARGIDREIRRALWVGAWLAAFLVGVGLLLPLVG